MRMIPIALMLAACAADKAAEPESEPEHVTVDHILFSFRGTGTRATRTLAEAKSVAYEVYALLEADGDWDQLKAQYTDDRSQKGLGGPYAMANNGVAPGPREFARTGMVNAFGDVGFKLKLGEMGMAVFSPADSKYGFHIIKRLK